MEQKVSEFLRDNLCLMAAHDAKIGLLWTPGSEATKYTKKFEKIFGLGRFSWCAAFVTFWLEFAGLPVPLYLPYTKFTSALCQAWEEFAKHEGLWLEKDSVPSPGDLVLFDWNHDDHDDHIGIFLGFTPEGHLYCAEGNVKNKTALTTRGRAFVKGFIRIPNGYQFPVEQLVG